MDSTDNISKEMAVLNETDGSEIIECSLIVNATDKKIKSEKKIIGNSPNKKEHSLLYCYHSNMINEALRLSLKKTFKLLPESLSGQKSTKYCECGTSFKTPVSCRNHNVESAEKTLVPSLQKYPNELPYISRTKMRNVERWLEHNDVETVRTPPFANLSVTPVSTGRKRYLKRQKERERLEEKCLIDSDIEGVLKAVYGSDWVAKNIAVKSKTEPKKRMNNNTTLTKKLKNSSVYSFTKSLLRGGEEEKKKNEKSDEIFCLDDSIISGIGMINLDETNLSLKQIRNLNADSGKGNMKSEETCPPNPPKLLSNKEMSNDWTGRRIRVNERAKKEKEKSQKIRISNQDKKKTFLASLSVSTPTSRTHPDADYYKINFKAKKDELIRKLFKLYNGEIFDERLPNDMNFSWNVKLRGTAGYCYNKRITKSTGEILRVSRIEFSTKIVDRADRLRDTMIHELCHAASWIVNGTLDGHGAIWNSWATKAAQRFPELPEIRRCHNYDIVAKYIYRCTGCGYSIKRHSKSINIERKRCGHCFGALELLLNKKRKGKTEVPEFDATRTLRTPNRFAMFVKENYRSVKDSNTKAKHAEIMKILSEQYAQSKTENEKDLLS